MKIASVVGARPQFVKASVVSRELRSRPDVSETIIHTGQHYDDEMSRVFFEELDIPNADHNLGIGSAGHGAQTGRMLEALEGVFEELQPDWVIVYGDTNSTLAGALAAVKMHIACAHVEAGLRSHNRLMPEEINRVVADHVADLLLAPTDLAVANLRAEGITPENIEWVGDVMYDVALEAAAKAADRSTIMEDLGLSAQGFVLATVHRAENTDDPQRLAAIVEGLDILAATIPVLLPAHPRTREALERNGLHPANLRLGTPVGYLDMVMLEKNARLVVTDSGGVQKEAFFHRVPCATLRNETEWVELIDLGWNHLVPPGLDGTGIAARLTALLDSAAGIEASPYGDGNAAGKIADRLLQ